MGIDRTDYVIYGYKLSKEQIEKHNIKWTEDQFDPYICGAPAAGEYRLVVDQICGDYIVFGKLVHQSGRRDKDFTIFDPYDFVHNNVSPMPPCEYVIDLFVELFGNEVYDDGVSDNNPRLIAFTHLN